jgi:hypothetical protein
LPLPLRLFIQINRRDAKAKADAQKAKAEANKAKADARTARAKAKARAYASSWDAFDGDAEEKTIHSGPRDRLVKALGMLGSVHAGGCFSLGRLGTSTFCGGLCLLARRCGFLLFTFSRLNIPRTLPTNVPQRSGRSAELHISPHVVQSCSVANSSFQESGP